MLLSSDNARRERNKEKLLSLLTFLKEETYSDFNTLMMFFGFRGHKSLYTLLNKAIKMGLVIKHEMDLNSHKLSLWGITNDGIAVVYKPGEQFFPQRFEPCRLSGWSLDHHLKNQSIRLILEGKGATDWLHGDRATYRSRYNVKHRPDGLMALPDGRLFAVETELSLKTKRRYQSIMASHLQARTEKHWFYVFYITPDEAKRNALRAMFNSITHVTALNEHVLLEQRHRNVFRFYTIDELKNLELHNYA
ncbi:MobC family replication-relaxation protein [Enterobacter cloacae]|uniref:MobC family replication-relaxation protein n=1 Tax=Enterobacter cloacae TaxID=550 RepID=UPI002FFA45AB